MKSVQSAGKGRVLPKTRIACGLGVVAVAGLMFAGVYAVTPTPQAVADDAAAASGPVKEGTIAHNPNIGSLQDYTDVLYERAEEYAPEVRTLEDGTRVQLTPNYDVGYLAFTGTPRSYNTYDLDGDNRGCVSCHTEGLKAVIENLEYKHYEVDNGLGTDMTPMDCRNCHNDNKASYQTQKALGSLIHGIHNRVGVGNNCFSCHDATADGNGLRLWEEAKYDIMWGISDVTANEDGTLSVVPIGSHERGLEAGEGQLPEMSYDQTTTTDMFTVSWLAMGRDMNDERFDMSLQGQPLDQEVFDTWPISVSGMVDEPFEMTLPELIDEAPVETFYGANACIMNWPGGELMQNLELKGVPLSWFLEKAGIQDGARSARVISIDGATSARFSLDDLDDPERMVYLCFEANGEQFDWTKGFPLIAWSKTGGPATRMASEIVVSDSEVYVQSGRGWIDGLTYWVDPAEDNIGENTPYYNKPNAGIMNFHEGQIIEAGQPYTFEGYAWGNGEQITSVEFSLDRGETWVTMDTSDTDKSAWVHWNFTWTPPETPGAYVLTVRATTENGYVSRVPDQVMFNAQISE